MPFAVPTDHAHLPPFDPRAYQVTYDLWHGYRRLGRDGQGAAFPFGFGLSYSRFSYADPVGEHLPDSPAAAGQGGSLRVSVTVTNSGAMAAEDVVQVYVEPPGLAVERPARFLAGFARIGLEPAESRRLSILIPLRRLAWFDERRDVFVLEAGKHRLLFARHAEDHGIGMDLELEDQVVGR
jgi:beta-glucosidase